MEEFEPKKKKIRINKEFLAKYSYVFVLAVLLIGGISYGYTFFIQNRKIASGSITTANLTVNFTDRSINATGLSVPANDQEGLIEFTKTLTITNQTTVDGRVKLTLTRTSGLELTDLRYALSINGVIQEINDVPTSGEILTTAIMGSETINVEVRLWPKTSYAGSATTFVGELTPEIKYLGSTASSLSSPAGNYVNFNCNGSTCEVWQIVKIEDGRLVLTRQADYTGATERPWTGKYYEGLSFNNDSFISSVSDDNDHKNVYLLRTVKIASGTGTEQDPYVLTNSVLSEPDKKSIATITYSDGTTSLGTQKIYYGETNYISKLGSSKWIDTSGNSYGLGDTIVSNSDVTLITISASSLDFDNTITGFNCTNVQCALEALNDLFG